MQTLLLKRTSKLAASFAAAFGLTVFGFSGVGAAHQASIDTTGPDSDNYITITENDICTATNVNSVGINNMTYQTGMSGDVQVNNNTTAGTGWGAWDPGAWQQQGYSYAQWQAAFSAWMQSNAGSWQAAWGNLPTGSGIGSGNVSNSNHTNFQVGINNGDGCAHRQGSGNNNGSIDTTGPGSNNDVTLGANTVANTYNGNVLSANNFTGQTGVSGSVTASGNTSVGGAVSGSTHNGNGTSGMVHVQNPGSGGNSGGGQSGGSGSSCNGSIGTTGPGSNNYVTCSHNNKVTVTNSNMVSFNNATTQTGTSGSTTVNNNTTAGGSGSGGTGNTNASTFVLSVNN